LQLGELTDQLIDYWRGLMLLNATDGEAVADLAVADHHKDAVRQQARALTLDTILAGLDVLTTTKSRLRLTGHGQVLLETAVVRLSRLDELVPVAQLAQWLSQPGSAPPVARPTLAAAATGDGSKKNGLTAAPDGLRLVANGTHLASEAALAAVDLTDATLTQIWDKVKIEVGVMLAAELSKGGIPAIAGPRTLVLRFPSSYNHAYEYCREPAKAERAETALKAATSQDWALRFELTAGPAPVAASPPISQRERERRALETPLLSRIVGQLEGRLLKMDEGFGETVNGASIPPPG
jgi:DNA polymerase-3 subunit gamma/tau